MIWSRDTETSVTLQKKHLKSLALPALSKPILLFYCVGMSAPSNSLTDPPPSENRSAHKRDYLLTFNNIIVESDNF